MSLKPGKDNRQTHTNTHTYSEGGALLNDGRQLREADVHGKVPCLPVEGTHTCTQSTLELPHT